jgi:hypothetical protein
MTRVTIKTIVFAGLTALATLSGCSERAANNKLTDRAAAAANYRPRTQAEAHNFVQQISPLVNRTKVVVVKQANGKFHADLSAGGGESVLIARRNSDGSISQGCVQTAEQAESFLTANTPGATKKLEVR